MDDVQIEEFSSVEHWEPPFVLLVTRHGVRIQDKTYKTIAAVNMPAWYSPDQKARIGNTVSDMFELRHANWEASL
jgi:hypothetical protein